MPINPLIINFVKANVLHEISRISTDLTPENQKNYPNFYELTQNKVDALKQSISNINNEAEDLVSLLSQNPTKDSPEIPSILQAAEMRRSNAALSFMANLIGDKTKTIDNITDPAKLVAISLFQRQEDPIIELANYSDLEALQSLLSQTKTELIPKESTQIPWRTEALPKKEEQVDDFVNLVKHNLQFLAAMQQVNKFEDQIKSTPSDKAEAIAEIIAAHNAIKSITIIETKQPSENIAILESLKVNALENVSNKLKEILINQISQSQGNTQNKSKDLEADRSKIIEQVIQLSKDGLLSNEDQSAINEALEKLEEKIQTAKQSEIKAKETFNELIAKASEKPIFDGNDISSTSKVSTRYNEKRTMLNDALIENLRQHMSEEDQKTVASLVKQTLSTIDSNENSALTDIKNDILKIQEMIDKVDVENSFTNVVSLDTLENVKAEIEQPLNTILKEIEKFDVSETQALRENIESKQQKINESVQEVENYLGKIIERKNKISELANSSIVTGVLDTIDESTSFNTLLKTEDSLNQKLQQLEILQTEINNKPPASKIQISNDHLKDFTDAQIKANSEISAKIEAIKKLQADIIQHKDVLHQAAQGIIQSIQQDTTVGTYDVKATNADIHKQFQNDIKKIESIADNISQFSKEDQIQINQAIQEKLNDLATKFDTIISQRNQISEQLQNDIKQTLSAIKTLDLSTFSELSDSQNTLAAQISKLENMAQTYNMPDLQIQFNDLTNQLIQQVDNIANKITQTAITNAQQINILELPSIEAVSQHQQKTIGILKELADQIPENASPKLKEQINQAIELINENSKIKINTFILDKNNLVADINIKLQDLNARLDLALKIGDIETLAEEIHQSNENFKIQSDAIDESLKNEIEPLLVQLNSCRDITLAKIENIKSQIQFQQQALNALKPESFMANVDSLASLKTAKKSVQAEIDSLVKEINKFDKTDTKDLRAAIGQVQSTLNTCLSDITQHLKIINDLTNKVSGLGNSSLLSTALPKIDDSTSFSALEKANDNLRQQLSQLDGLKTEINKKPPTSKIEISDKHLQKLTDAQTKTNDIINDRIKAIENLQENINARKASLHEKAEKIISDIQSKQLTGNINPSKSMSEIKSMLDMDCKNLSAQFNNGIDGFSPEDQENITLAISTKVAEFERLAHATITQLEINTQTVRTGIQETNGLFDFKSKKSVAEINELTQNIQQRIDTLETTLTDIDSDQRQELASQIGELKTKLEQRSQQRLGVLKAEEKAQNIINTIEGTKIDPQASSIELNSQKQLLLDKVNVELRSTYIKPEDQQKIKALLDSKAGDFDKAIQSAKTKEAVPIQAKKDFDALLLTAQEKPPLSEDERFSTAKVNAAYNAQLDIIKDSNIGHLRQQMNTADRQGIKKLVTNARYEINNNKEADLAFIKNALLAHQKAIANITKNMPDAFSAVDSIESLTKAKTAIQAEIDSLVKAIGKFDSDDTQELSTALESAKNALDDCVRNIQSTLKESLIAEIDSIDLEKDIALAERIADVETRAEETKQTINAFKNSDLYKSFQQELDTIIDAKIEKIDEFAKQRIDRLAAATKIQKFFKNKQETKNDEANLAIAKKVQDMIFNLEASTFDDCKNLDDLKSKRVGIDASIKEIEAQINKINPPIEKLSSKLATCKTSLTQAIRDKGLEIIKAALKEIESKVDFTKCKSAEEIGQKVKEAEAALEKQFKEDSKKFNPDDLEQFNLQKELIDYKTELKEKLTQTAQEAKEQLLMQQADNEATKVDTKRASPPPGKPQDKQPTLYGHLTGQTIQDFFTKQTSGDPNYRVNINCHQLQLSSLDNIYQGNLHTASGIKILSDSGQQFEFSMDKGIPKARLAHAETQPKDNETQAQTDARLADTLMTMMDNIIANGNQIRINTKSPMDAAICQQYLNFLMNEGGLTNLKASINGASITADTTLEQVLGNKALCDKAINEEKIPNRAKAAFESVMQANITNTDKPDTYANYKDYLAKDVINTMKKSIAIEEFAQNDENEADNRQSFSFSNHV